LVAFITTVGNNSNLVLDPDIDSYYTMDSIITQTPQVVVNAGKARDVAVAVARRKTLSADDKTRLIVLLGQISTPLDTVQSDLSHGVKFNETVKTSLDSAAQNLHAATTQFMGLLNTKIVQADAVSASENEIAQACEGVFDAGRVYHRAVVATLDRLLEKRM